MKLKQISATILVLVALAAAAPAAEWEIDVPHTTVTFKVSHLVVTTQVGNFNSFSGKVWFDGENLADAKVEMIIDVASVDTDNDDRDNHLRSEDFFDAAKHPQITFKSTKVISSDGKKFQLVGDMTMKGVTKQVTFDCVYKGTAEFMGTTKAGFTAETQINRKDFGLTWSKTLETGGLVVGDEVKIELEVEVNKVG